MSWQPSEGLRLKFLLDQSSATIWWIDGISAYVKFDDGRYGTYNTKRMGQGDSKYICERFEPACSA